MATETTKQAAMRAAIQLAPQILKLKSVLGLLYGLAAMALGLLAAVLWAIGAASSTVALTLGFALLLTLWAKRV